MRMVNNEMVEALAAMDVAVEVTCGTVVADATRLVAEKLAAVAAAHEALAAVLGGMARLTDKNVGELGPEIAYRVQEVVFAIASIHSPAMVDAGYIVHRQRGV